MRPISRERARKTTHFGVFLNSWNHLGVELWPMPIFIGGKRAATLPEIQNSIKLKDLGPETYLTTKSAKKHAEWFNSELLERSGRRVMPKLLYLYYFMSNQTLDATVANGFLDVMTS